MPGAVPMQSHAPAGLNGDFFLTQASSPAAQQGASDLHPRDGGSRGPPGSGNLAGGSADTPSLLRIVLMPFSCVFFILLAVILGRGASNSWCWIVFTLLFLQSTLYTVQRMNGKHSAEAMVGLLCVIACVASLILGVYGYQHFLRHYYEVGQGASYFNVLATDSAGSRSDATSLIFSNGTRVDSARTYGYLDVTGSNHGNVYCIAPISDGADEDEGRIQYFAAGLNCCYQRSAFDCEESSVPGARSAVVLNRGADADESLRAAVQGALHAYSMQASEDYLLVAWVNEPNEWRNRMWYHSLQLFAAFSFVYLLFSCMLGVTLNQAFKQ